MAPGRPDLNEALTQFEKVGVNLEKLEKIWARLRDANSAEEHDELAATYRSFLPNMPPIKGFVLSTSPLPSDVVEAERMSASTGGVEALDEAERRTDAPGEELRSYRLQFDRERRVLVRSRVTDVVDAIDQTLVRMTWDAQNTSAKRDDWDELSMLYSELRRLVGPDVQERGRWSDLTRHIRFGTDGDLRDIVSADWPSVKDILESSLYDQNEPVPVPMGDLGDLVAARPTGVVSNELAWSRLGDDQFERLLYDLLRTTESYENVSWLMRTHAPDGGRDIQAFRLVSDTLMDVDRLRVIVQCKHWTTKSVAPGDLTDALAFLPVWEPPPVDILIIATSGRFTKDAVTIVERHNLERKRPRIEMWPESKIEALLSTRLDLVTSFSLR